MRNEGAWPVKLGGALAVALLAVPLDAAPPSTIRVGLLNRTATNWALYAGIDQKFFAEEGVVPEVKYLSASGKLAADLIEGRIDVGNMAAGNVVELAGKGHDLVIVMGVNRPVFSLVAHPRIKHPQELRGARIGVDNGRAGYVHLVRRYLAANGIEASQVPLMPVGGVDARHRAMLAGDIDAALLSAPRDLEAIEKGYTMLADVTEQPEHYTGSTAVTRRAWAAANRDTLVSYFRGYKRALDWLYDCANADAASRLLARELSLPEARARRIYDSSISQKRWLVRDGMVHSEGMRQVAREMDPNAPFRFEDYVDLGFWRAAAR